MSLKQRFYYLIGSLFLLLCIIIVVICIPFIAIGEAVTFIATKVMQIGDEIEKFGNSIKGE